MRGDLQLCSHPHAPRYVYRVQDFFPLHASILRRDAAAVQAALHRGIAFAKQDAHGNPPLHCAVATGDPALVKLLIDGGANVALRNLAGNTPLESAFALVRPPKVQFSPPQLQPLHRASPSPAASPPCRASRMSRASSRRAAPKSASAWAKTLTSPQSRRPSPRPVAGATAPFAFRRTTSSPRRLRGQTLLRATFRARCARRQRPAIALVEGCVGAAAHLEGTQWSSCLRAVRFANS